MKMPQLCSTEKGFGGTWSTEPLGAFQIMAPCSHVGAVSVGARMPFLAVGTSRRPQRPAAGPCQEEIQWYLLQDTCLTYWFWGCLLGVSVCPRPFLALADQTAGGAGWDMVRASPDGTGDDLSPCSSPDEESAQKFIPFVGVSVPHGSELQLFKAMDQNHRGEVEPWGGVAEPHREGPER